MRGRQLNSNCWDPEPDTAGPCGGTPYYSAITFRPAAVIRKCVLRAGSIPLHTPQASAHQVPEHFVSEAAPHHGRQRVTTGRSGQHL
jgi:hypothetical protein